MLNCSKSDPDVLAYPPKLIFHPTLDAYRDVLFGSASILPNLISSMVISFVGTTIVTMLMAKRPQSTRWHEAFRGKKFAGFYVLTTQMLPPVGIIIPYFLVLRNIGWISYVSGNYHHRSVVFVAVRDLAAGVLLRGHTLRDGRAQPIWMARAGYAPCGELSYPRSGEASP